jgi:hypothetical protein
MSGAGHFQNVPLTTDSLTVTAQVAQALSPIANVMLHYRVMFNSEVAMPMSLADTNGTWTSTIPAGVATAGQLIRYYVTATDADGNVSRWPIFPRRDGIAAVFWNRGGGCFDPVASACGFPLHAEPRRG